MSEIIIPVICEAIITLGCILVVVVVLGVLATP